MKIKLSEAMEEVKREQADRTKRYSRMIQANIMHKDHANRQYRRLEAVEKILSVMTEVEWNDLLRRQANRIQKVTNDLFTQQSTKR